MKNMNMINHVLVKNTKKTKMFFRNIMKGIKKNYLIYLFYFKKIEIHNFILIVLSNVAFLKIKLLKWHF